MRKGGGWNIFIHEVWDLVWRCGFEMFGGEALTLGEGDGREFNPARGDISKREDGGSAGLVVTVDEDFATGATVIKFNGGTFEIEIGDSRLSSGCPEDGFAFEFVSVGEGDFIVCFSLSDLADGVLKEHTDTVCGHRGGEMFCHIGVEAAHEFLAAMEEGSFHAELAEDGCEFAGDISPADDEDFAREFREVEEVI